MITQQYLKDNFEYRNGNLYRTTNVANNKIKAGEPGGKLHKATGYYRICIKGKRYKLHTMIYLYHFGITSDRLDHIDRDKSNNSIENLRLATVSENNCNQKIRKDNSTGMKGISIYSKYNRIHAQIQFNGKKIHKCFSPISNNNIELAKDWIKLQRNNLHGEFGNHGT